MKPKMRVVRAFERKAENDVKKKIRAIQYGVGPIGASIARLMRKKQAIEIIGAIDTDPAKIGRDLGEVVGATDAPWGAAISGDAKEVLEQNADVVLHSTSSSLAKVTDQLLACLEAESCIVSTCEELSYPFRTHPELAAKLDAAAKEWGVALVGTGVNPGFVMDKLVVTLAAVAQRIEHAKAVRIVDASKRRLPLQKKIGAGMTVEEFRAQVKAGVIKHVGLPESVEYKWITPSTFPSRRIGAQITLVARISPLLSRLPNWLSSITLRANTACPSRITVVDRNCETR